jgi:N-acyl homoserine lactone hydrolase
VSERDGEPSVSVEALWVGEVPAPEAWVFRPVGSSVARWRALLSRHGPTVTLPLLAFVVRHPSAGVLLIDTGLHPSALRDVRGDYGRITGLLFRALRPGETPFDVQLEQAGLAPGEIDRVIMTHLHVDHTSGMRLLPAATFILARREMEGATGRLSSLNGYAAAHLPEQRRMRLIDFEREGEPHGPFAQTVDLIGDGSVRLISTPGHTPGHLSVLLRTAQAPVLVIGDAVYTLRSLEQEQLPFRTANDSAYRRSMQEIKLYAQANPDAILIPTHDAGAYRRIASLNAAGQPA